MCIRDRPQILQNADVADFSKGINGVIAVPGISLLDIGTDQTVLLIIPVSYTHLDVYKRQVRESRWLL